MDIKKLIGETTEYDKKQSVEIRRPKSWLKSVSAFANGDGGYLILGLHFFLGDGFFARGIDRNLIRVKK